MLSVVVQMYAVYNNCNVNIHAKRNELVLLREPYQPSMQI